MTSQDTAPAPVDPSRGEPTPGAAERPRRGRRALLATAGLLTVAVAAGGGTLYLRSPEPAPRAAVVGSTGSTGNTGGGQPQPVAPAAPAVLPGLSYAGLRPDGLVPWQAPLVLSVTDGTLTEVTGTGPDGAPVTGTVGPDGRWTASTALVPASTYALVASVRDAAGATRSVPVPATTTAPTKTFKVSVAPGDGATVGVGQAVSVRLGTPVKDPALRAAVERSLTVTTVPAVQGAWRWMSSSELRYRGPELWAAGTTINVSAALNRVQATPGVWGAAPVTSTFTVGDALTSVVDVQAHTMTVYQNGQVARVMKASMGKRGFETRNGTFVVLEKFADRIMDSATVDLPPGTEPYRTAVKDAVRITNSGTFTHGAPWSVRSQGRTNVSHGCINLSPVDADWYYQQAKRGDVVTVVNSTVGPVLSDAGSQDWNLTFDQWKAGSALA